MTQITTEVPIEPMDNKTPWTIVLEKEILNSIHHMGITDEKKEVIYIAQMAWKNDLLRLSYLVLFPVSAPLYQKSNQSP
jgi:hypothetical protein